MATGYEDIDRLTEQQNTLLEQQEQKQNDIINQQTQMQIDELNRKKEEQEKETQKTTSGLYTSYQKQANQYGAEMEQLVEQGLGNSGYAETAKTSLYNTYQRNVTDTINNAQKLKSDFDFQINQARQTGDITLAQNALEIYKQKMQLLTQEYELKNNREQFLYQKEQDALAQSNWEKEYAYQQQRDQIADSQWQQTFDYQKQRDQVADSQWAQEYALSQRRSSSSGSSSSANVSSNDNTVSTSNGSVSSMAQKLYDGISGLLKGNNANYNKETARQLIYNEQRKGNISEQESAVLFDTFGL